MPTDNTLLKLVAMESEDLAIISAHLQDAVARVGEMAYLPAEKRFAEGAARDDIERLKGAEQVACGKTWGGGGPGLGAHCQLLAV